MQLRNQLTASKSLSDLSRKEQLSKSPAVKSESLNNINVKLTDKSQKDYSLPPDDISTIIKQNILEINSRDDAGSYQTKSEETNGTQAESKAEVNLISNPQKNIDIKVEIDDLERMETKTILRKNQSHCVSPNPKFKKVENFV